MEKIEDKDFSLKLEEKYYTMVESHQYCTELNYTKRIKQWSRLPIYLSENISIPKFSIGHSESFNI